MDAEGGDDDEGRPTEAMAVPPVHDPVGADPIVEDLPLTLEPGVDVGGYVIDGELGRGGMGVVYSAKHPVIGKRAAIKVLKPSLSNNPATIERFIQEARSVNAIGHPNIVDIFDFDMLPDGRRFLVMDLLDGESLRKRVKRGPLPLHEIAMVIDEIASALDAAHAKGFIHRDLKPDNVFLVAHPGRFDVKLLDFGLAKLLPNSGLLSARAYRTATGAQLGTPDYMSPEQLRGEKDIDHRTDIYALGVVSFEMITGKRPKRYADGSFDLEAPIVTVIGNVAGMPGELAQLVETMLAGNREDRPSLVAVRAVIKRAKQTLPSMSMPMQVAKSTGEELAIPTPAEMGAAPVLPTPPEPARKPTNPPPVAEPSAADSAPVPLIPISRPMTPVVVQKLAQYAHEAQDSGLRPAGSPIPSTKIGAAPAPMITRTRSQPPDASVSRKKSSGRMWWIVGVVLVLAGAAIAFVLVTQ
ncbi:MAG: protein kinase [Kofleriaceae bacterium]